MVLKSTANGCLSFAFTLCTEQIQWHMHTNKKENLTEDMGSSRLGSLQHTGLWSEVENVGIDS